MKQAKRMTTAQQRAWILARGLQDQAGHTLGITDVRVISVARKHADGSIMTSLGRLLQQALDKANAPQPFVRLRFLHQRRWGLSWIKTAVDLREPTAVPLVWEWELKPGYYWNKEIH